MPGIKVFESLRDALTAGYQIYDRTREGYLERRKTSAGWTLALVKIRAGG